MALHGMARITIGVPQLEGVRQFYRDFGLSEGEAGRFSTRDGGEQLRLVHRPVRQLVELVVAADDADDLSRIARAAARTNVAVTEDGEGLALREPMTGIAVRVAIRPRIEQKPHEAVAMNAPGSSPRVGERSPAIFHDEDVRPRKLGHVIFATPDIERSQRFFIDVLGFKLSDSVPDLLVFMRCSADHHNVALMQSPVPFFHHSSWQVGDVDEIGHGASNLIGVDPTCDVWGLGRHFIGSNLFWYLRDPAGNFAEYYADLDQIVDDDLWLAKTWEPDKALYIWGPSVPKRFLVPEDLDEIAALTAHAGASSPA